MINITSLTNWVIFMVVFLKISKTHAFNTSASLCEHSNTVDNICDSSNILQTSEKQNISTLLKSTVVTSCAPTPPPKNEGEEDDEDEHVDDNYICRCGVHSHLYLIKNIGSQKLEDNKMELKMLAKKELALKENDDCSVVLVASEEDKLFGISVGNNAKEYVPDSCLMVFYTGQEALDFKSLLFSKMKEYLHVVNKKHSCLQEADIYDDQDLKKKVAIPLLLLISALIIAIIVGICIVYRRRQTAKKHSLSSGAAQPLKA